jgi:hypothetical protein
MKLPDPFAYPMQPHVRRHGPQGYSKHGEYRNWLRDEFAFRCVYCLRRETWLTMPRDFEIDHIIPVSKRRDLKLHYDNLCYACGECNGTKLAQLLPSPDSIAYGQCMLVDDNGVIHARDGSAKGREIIEVLDLNGQSYVRMRRHILTTISDSKPGTLPMNFCLGYPDDLPDLSQEREPKSNKRPNGIHESHFARKQRNELSEYY